jgi:hypothetical protein
MRRLFSIFANGWPGTGLLFMRIVACIALVDRPPLGPAILHVLATGAGILLLAGLWTPIGRNRWCPFGEAAEGSGWTLLLREMKQTKRASDRDSLVLQATGGPS